MQYMNIPASLHATGTNKAIADYTSPTLCTPPSYIWVRAIVWACSRGETYRQTDRLTDRHTDARDHNTFRVIYNSREMYQQLI